MHLFLVIVVRINPLPAPESPYH